MVEKDKTNETSNIIFGLNQNVITKFNSVLKIKKKSNRSIYKEEVEVHISHDYL